MISTQDISMESGCEWVPLSKLDTVRVSTRHATLIQPILNKLQIPSSSVQAKPAMDKSSQLPIQRDLRKLVVHCKRSKYEVCIGHILYISYSPPILEDQTLPFQFLPKIVSGETLLR